MVVAVLPLTVLLFFVVGGVRTWKEKDHQGLGVLFVINSLVPLLALSIGQSMVYDNERLFMPAFVFIAALAGIGVDWVLTGIQTRLKRAVLAVLLAVLVVLAVFLPHLLLAAPLYPHWLSYYSETVGGLPGATQIGLESTYWCETYTEALEYLNNNAQAGDTVWVDPWSHDVMVYYQMHGRLRHDVYISVPQYGASILAGGDAYLREVPYQKADFIVVHHRQTSYAEGGAAYPIMEWLGDRGSDFNYSYQGIPLIDVYRRP
jgi:hypothetical protein